MTDETPWISPSLLSTGYLGPETAPGLFVSTASLEAARFWVVEHPGGKVAVTLGGGGLKPLEVWSLQDEDAGDWFGVHLGQVELLLDPASIIADSTVAEVGDLLTVRDRLCLKARISGARGRTTDMPVAEVPALAPSSSHVIFSRWALVQYAASDQPQILYERKRPAKAATVEISF